MTWFSLYPLAGALGAFFLFALFGLLALVVTAMLDQKLGKERALLFYSLALLAFTFFVLRAAPPEAARVRSKTVKGLPSAASELTTDPFARPALPLGQERNVFEKFSDTRKLPPVELDAPPWIALDFPLPPTIPGPAPGYRRALRGALPVSKAGDGTAIAEIPAAVFTEYTPVAEDVYDWLLAADGKPFYIYIRAIKAPGGGWVAEGKRGFEELKWRLADQGEGWQELTIRFAALGPRNVAGKYLSKADILRKKQEGVAERQPGAGEQFQVRKTVANLYYKALRLYAIRDPAKAGENALRQAARKMAEVGKTGKEHKEGWRRAAELLEHALAWAKANGAPATQRADILLELLGAYRALRDDKASLASLAEYARTAPSNYRPWSWLGASMLELGIPHLGLAYYQVALDRNRTDAMSILGVGEALTWDGQYEQALATVRRAQGTPSARVRIAEAYLRLGQLEQARTEIERYLAAEPGNPSATLVRGAVYYALGDVETARGAFEAVATMPEARDQRAVACYDLGLACVRLGQHDAATSAFEACSKALELGSSLGRTPDETVAPSLGAALIALSGGDIEAARAQIEDARSQAPRSAYVQFLAGVLSERGGNTASAVRGLEESKRLAPEYAELDGWLAITYLRLGEQQVATGADAETATDYFRRAAAFAERAAAREARTDKLAFKMQLRLALVQLRLQDVPRKRRYENALATAKQVTSRSELRDQPAAHALQGYCHYGLGGRENIKQCMRDFGKVLDDVPDEAEHPWKDWRDYAESALAAVKHWDSLEEKTVTFDDTVLPKDWKADESNGVGVRLVDGTLRFDKEAASDGSFLDPSVTAVNQTLFSRDSLEEVSFDMRCPPKRAGVTSNNVTFGVQLLSGRGKGGKLPGIGFFYDKGKLAFRVGGGQKKAFQDGLPLRQGDDIKERVWPTEEWLHIRIARLDFMRGEVAIYMTGADGAEQELFRDMVSGFKRSRGKAIFWLGGWSNEAERFDVTIKNIRVVRRTK